MGMGVAIFAPGFGDDVPIGFAEGVAQLFIVLSTMLLRLEEGEGHGEAASLPCVVV